MQISRTKAVVLCAVVLYFQQCVADVTSVLSLISSSGSTGAVDCTDLNLNHLEPNVLSSSQFAKLCEVTGFLDNINTNFTDLISLNPLLDIPIDLIGKITADAVCYGDCQCVMGAYGGRCGTINGTHYCKCDYENPVELSYASKVITPLVCLATRIVTGVLCNGEFFKHELCNSDCQCSHGYGNTGNHVCRSRSSNDTRKYCFCGNGTNVS